MTKILSLNVQNDEWLVFCFFFVYTHIIMDYIVFDLEWNQCPDGKEFEDKSLPFEILEIGAVKLDSEYREIGRFSEKIRPSVYQTMHFRTREILHLDMEMLKNARTFPEVFQDFLAWCKGPVHFCTWGSLDLYELQRNLCYYGMKNPFRPPLMYFDIQKIFSIVYEDRKTRRSLEYAAGVLQVSGSMPFHSALNDAVYTAEILKNISPEDVLKNYSIDYYQNPRNRKEEIYAVFSDRSKFVSKEFLSKPQAMKDRKVTSTKCYLCQKNARRKIRWFSNGNGNYFSLSFCEEHGWLGGKIHIKKTAAGKYFCIKTLKLITDAEAEEMCLRKEALNKKTAGNKSKSCLNNARSK